MPRGKRGVFCYLLPKMKALRVSSVPGRMHSPKANARSKRRKLSPDVALQEERRRLLPLNFGSDVGTSAKGGKMKHQTISKLALAVLSLSLLGSASAFAYVDRGHGPDGLGQAGMGALARNALPQADDYYYSEYLSNPGNPLAIYNWARTLQARGHLDQANVFYHQAAASGANYIPDILLEFHDANTTIRDVACKHLAENRVADPNCPGFTAEAPAAPYPMISQAAPAAAVRDFTVFFDFDKADITPEARQVIASAVDTAKRSGPVRITVTGHTDTVGSQAYNQRLSERRAEAVKSEMMRQGMNAADIATVGRSFNDPLVPTGPGVKEAQNRRAVIVLGPPAVARNF
jgi:outer membrane protein OmpA-like peptidoglycan-associated protein